MGFCLKTPSRQAEGLLIGRAKGKGDQQDFFDQLDRSTCGKIWGRI
jgi:hypothetical protein